MASNINPFNVDGTFPVAGQDNSSQGFRDNFTNIVNNLSFAASEISDLQAKAVLISPLNGSTINNNFAGTPITAAQLRGISETINNNGTVAGAITLDYSTGSAQKIASGAALNISFTNFPASGLLGRMIVWFNITAASHTVTFSLTSPGITMGASQIANFNTTTGVLTFDVAGNYLFEFSSIDGGQNILIRDLTRNYNNFNGTNFYYNPTISTTTFVGFGGVSTTTQAATQVYGTDTVSIIGTHNAVSVGNLFQANVSKPIFDTGITAGYTVTAARGNATLANLSPVIAGDYVGYLDAIVMTGNGTANTFQQISSVGFYATGANLTYGLGGNIAFFTAKDGGGVGGRYAGINGGFANVYQAVGIENDQSIKFYGNTQLAGTFAPPSATSPGTAGQITYDANFVYVCIGSGNWKRAAIAGGF